jgi:predicted RNA methylase
MRLAAQAKAGFYPAAPEAIRELVKHLRPIHIPPDRTKFDAINILDPCAGEGLALGQIGAALGLDARQIYAVELDAARTERIKANIPGLNLLGPASFLGVQITGFSFGLAYVNPPFDDELGGGRREEQAFAERATRMLVSKGVLVLVCPSTALAGNRSFVEFLDSHYEESALYKFPDGFRPYRELVFVGKKRKQEIPRETLQEQGQLHKMQLHHGWYFNLDALPALGHVQPKSWSSNGYPSSDCEDEIRVWDIPASWKPHTFKKTAFTDLELIAVVHSSPLNALLEEVIVPPPQAPPLPLDKGHLGLILASGMLDGVVEGPHGVHVVRGSSHKVEYHNKEQSSSDENPETGAVTTKDVYSQRMVTVIRVVEQDGVIQTFSNEPEEKEAQNDDE